MKLIIIGNGFDLHHGYKTSFSDFRNHLLNSKNETDRKLMSDVDIILKSKNIDIENGILWNDFERIIGQIMSKGSNVKVKEIELMSLVEKFAERFYHYLIEESKRDDLTKNAIISKEFEKASLILTFNYTKFYLPYIEDKKTDIFHIHGELIEQNLPLIGYFYPKTSPFRDEVDFLVRFNDKAFHKPALAYKQNELILDKKIKDFETKWASQFSEITIIGYSFGESDSHIYNILNKILLKQNNNVHIPISKIDSIPVIKLKVFNYNMSETEKLIDRLKQNLLLKNHRRSFVDLTGSGFTRKRKSIITFEIINYIQ